MINRLRRNRLKFSFAIGGLLAVVPIAAGLLIYLSRPGSLWFAICAGLFLLAMPGTYLTALIFGAGHGPSVVQMVLVGIPLNFGFYFLACYVLTTFVRWKD